MSGEEILSEQFVKNIINLEKTLRSNNITLKELRTLLKLYKTAINYYTVHDETQKNIYASKYKYTLQNQTVVKLIKSNTMKLNITKSKSICKTEETKYVNILESVEKYYKDQMNVLKQNIEKQEEELQKRIICRARNNEEILTETNTTGSCTDTSDIIEDKSRTVFSLFVEMKAKEGVENIIKSWMEGIQRKVQKMEDERDKEMEEQAVSFSNERRELEEKLTHKYIEAKEKAMKLPERIREVSLKMLKDKHEVKLAQELTSLKDKQSKEKKEMIRNYRERLHRLIQFNNSPEFILKLKESLRNNPFSPIGILTQNKSPLVSPLFVNNSKKSLKQIKRGRKAIKENLMTIDSNLTNAKEVLKSLYINKCDSRTTVREGRLY